MSEKKETEQERSERRAEEAWQKFKSVRLPDIERLYDFAKTQPGLNDALRPTDWDVIQAWVEKYFQRRP